MTTQVPKWFLPEEASRKRDKIHRLVEEMRANMEIIEKANMKTRAISVE
jgi:hypothetical protein